MVVVKVGEQEYYIDNKLQRSLDRVKKKVTQKDEDYFFAIDGEEGSGKSVLTMQLAKYLDPTFNLSRLVFDAKQFEEAVMKAKKGQSIVFDEAFRGLSSRGALSGVNKILVSLMMEMRQKNLYVFVVMPTFFLLDKYAAIFRSRGLFHVYKNAGRRGYWVFFNKKKKKLLYLKGKPLYSYAFPRSKFRGRFMEYYTVDEKEYRKKKGLAFKNSRKGQTKASVMLQRNLLLWFINKDMGVSLTQMKLRFKELGWKTGRSTLHDPIKKTEEVLRRKKIID